MKPFLLLQLRPEDEASDGEYDSFLKAGGLSADEMHRIRIEQGNLPKINLDNYSGVIVGGGPSNVSGNSKDEIQQQFESCLHSLLDEIIERDFPYFGTCYGLGILSSHLGGTVSKEHYNEAVGAVDINLTEAAKDDPLMAGLPSQLRAFTGHKEACQNIPSGALLLATHGSCPVQLIRVKQNIYGSQFHPELDVPSIVIRIKVYKNAGYFPPEEADDLIAKVSTESITIPETIFRRFIEHNKCQPRS